MKVLCLHNVSMFSFTDGSCQISSEKLLLLSPTFD